MEGAALRGPFHFFRLVSKVSRQFIFLLYPAAVCGKLSVYLNCSLYLLNGERCLLTIKFRKIRVCVFALALSLALVLTPASGQAVLADVYFTAVNEQLLDMSSDTMPFWSGGVLYVSSQMFEGTDLGVNYVRNNAMGLAMLYTNRIDLRFDLEDQMAYDKRGNVYDGYAIERGGIIFFPLDLVCRYFGLTWSYSKTDLVPLIRVKSSSGILDDAGFIDAASTQMADRYANYEKSLLPAPDSPGQAAVQPDPPVSVPQPVQAAEGQKVFLLLDASSREDTLEALQILGGVQASFLLGPEAMEDGDLLRALVAGGHGLVLRMDSGTEEELENARDLMWQGCCSWLDLAWYEGRGDTGAMLEESGCAKVEADLDWRNTRLRNGEQVNEMLQSAEQYREDFTVYLGRAGDCIGGLPALLDALKEAGYHICAFRP